LVSFCRHRSMSDWRPAGVSGGSRDRSGSRAMISARMSAAESPRNAVVPSTSPTGRNRTPRCQCGDRCRGRALARGPCKGRCRDGAFACVRHRHGFDVGPSWILASPKSRTLMWSHRLRNRQRPAREP
jgi:hypothetical protein